MAKLSPWYIEEKLIGYSIYCPGCNISHNFQTAGSKMDAWEFNGDFFKPTFKPSMNIKFSNDSKRRCHFYVTDGKIEYCPDTAHEYSGKTIKIPDIGLALIAAMTPSRVIGKDNDMPWPTMREDLKFFYKITLKHKYMIMGRKTFESIDRVLPGRVNIVVSRDTNFATKLNERFKHISDKDSPVVITGGENPLMKAIITAFKNVENPIIIGGGKIYEEILPQVETMYITMIKNEYEGDTYFPEVDIDNWDVRIIGESARAVFTVWNRKN